MAVFLSLLAIAVLLVAAWLDRRARRRVQAITAHDITPEEIRYVMTRKETTR